MRKVVKGRGSLSNPKGRFERLEIEPDPDVDPRELGRPETVFLDDGSRSIITYNKSPDIPFEASINPYRGCEHGCSYCYARPFHEYLGFSAGLDFETRILVKRDAAGLLRREIESPRWQPQVLALSGVTDPYQPVEKRLEITRACLEVLARVRNPVMITTKNHLVTRDLDHLGELARHRAATVALSITTLDGDLARRLEPRASHPRRRLKAVSALAQAGVPAGVLVAPIIPALNDHEIPAVLDAAAAAGASYASFVVLRLPFGVGDLFGEWLDSHFPDRKDKVLNRLGEMRGGRMAGSGFGDRMRGRGTLAEQVRDLFALGCRRAGLARRSPELSTASFRRPREQLRLF